MYVPRISVQLVGLMVDVEVFGSGRPVLASTVCLLHLFFSPFSNWLQCHLPKVRVVVERILRKEPQRGGYCIHPWYTTPIKMKDFSDLFF